MKFKVGDQVIVTGGKDKGKKSQVVRVFPELNRVTVKDVNMYTKHIKPAGERSGERVRLERPLPLANIAILNDKGQPDRIGYKLAKDGSKERVFKKSGKVVPVQKPEKAKK
jgi:large subunit ribosomal protein L24